MTILAVAMVLVGLGIFALAIRGRVVQRGVFCRRCRFDLAGLAIDEPGSRCPECGSEVHEPTKRRVVLRRRSRLGLTVSVLLILGMGGLLAVGLTGRANLVYAQMPDTPLGWFARSGSETALDELVTRVTATNPKDALKHWNSAIQAGLAVQADKSIAWDPRWGEVLFQGCLNQQMTDKQFGRYMLNSTVVDLKIRDRVRQSGNAIGYTLGISQDRLQALSGGVLGYERNIGVVEFGVAGHPAIHSREGGSGVSGKVTVLGRRSAGVGAGLMGSLWKMKPHTDAEIGTMLPVYLEYKAEFVRITDEAVVFTQRIRFEQEVTILDPNEPIVAVYEDFDAVQEVCRQFSISPVYITPEFDEAERWRSFLGFQIESRDIQVPVAMRVFVRVEGEEVEVGSVVRDGTSLGWMGTGIQWYVRSHDQAEMAKAKAVHAELLTREKVDIVLRTDASVADQYPNVDRVLDLMMEFADVPIEVVDEHISYFETDPDCRPSCFSGE